MSSGKWSKTLSGTTSTGASSGRRTIRLSARLAASCRSRASATCCSTSARSARARYTASGDELQARLMPLRQGEIDVRRKAVRARELVQRRVRRIDQVADVRYAAESRVARLQTKGREEQATGLAHLGRGAALGEPLPLEAEVRAQRLGDELAERVRALGLEGGWGAGQEHAHQRRGKHARTSHDDTRARAIFTTKRRGEIRSDCNWILLSSPGTTSRRPRFSPEYPTAATAAGVMVVPGRKSRDCCMLARAANPVAVGPGHSVVTVIPLPASSSARASENDTT